MKIEILAETTAECRLLERAGLLTPDARAFNLELKLDGVVRENMSQNAPFYGERSCTVQLATTERIHYF